MKKCVVAVALILLLSACGAKRDFETMSGVVYEQPNIEAATISLALPEEAAMCVMEDPLNGTAYLCGDYCVTVSTQPGGDLDATLRSSTGFSGEQLRPVTRTDGENKRYECVWVAAGEGADQMCRAVVLDDGNYHYVLTLMGNASEAGQMRETWQQIIDSFEISIDP